MAERADADAVEAVEAMQQGEERLDCGVGLGVDVEVRIGEFFEEIGQEWNRVIVGHPCSGHLAPCELADRTGPTAGATQIVVVERSQHAIGGRVDVGLEMSIAEFVRVAERRHRVFGGEAGSATVREWNEASVVVDREVSVRLHRISIV